MARARNIKPAFFSNDELAEIDPIGRLLFIGLWTICDYKGNLELRHKKIKASILPYDNCEIEKIMINLEQSGFIQSYSNEGAIYINITNFQKHQNPHKNEKLKGSDTPCISDKESQLYDLKGNSIKSEKVTINPDNNGTNRADSLFLIPDSPSLIPETLKPESEEKKKSQKSAAPALSFDSWSSIPSDDVLKEWLSHRKKRKLSISQLVVNKMTGEINKAVKMGYSVDTCLSEIIERGWQGFNSDWIKNGSATKTVLHNLSDKDYNQHEGSL